jgi:undecaprenyl-diphosphatase
MPGWLEQADRAAFLFLNGLHADFLDPVFYYGTRSLLWLPFYLFLFYLVVRRFGWKSVWILLLAAIMITLSDQLSNLFKDWVARPRPTHTDGLSGIHVVQGYLGGEYGFYSAHASSNMAIAVFLIILLGQPFRYFPAMMILYALFMSYTRIYLGVHYPLDIITGWIAGGVLGWGFGQICGYLVHTKDQLKEEPFS